jgi:hypothetical protein
MLRSRKYGPRSAGWIARLASSTMLLLALAGCDRQQQPAPDGAHREAIHGFQTTFYRVSDGKQRWIEVAISVDGSRTFRMPVFFVHNGELVQIEDEEARTLIDKWVKNRAENIAAFGSLDPQAGMKGPFLAIDRNRP